MHYPRGLSDQARKIIQGVRGTCFWGVTSKIQQEVHVHSRQAAWWGEGAYQRLLWVSSDVPFPCPVVPDQAPLSEAGVQPRHWGS